MARAAWSRLDRPEEADVLSGAPSSSRRATRRGRFLARTTGELARVAALTGSADAEGLRAAAVAEADALGAAGIAAEAAAPGPA